MPKGQRNLRELSHSAWRSGTPQGAIREPRRYRGSDRRSTEPGLVPGATRTQSGFDADRAKNKWVEPGLAHPGSSGLPSSADTGPWRRQAAVARSVVPEGSCLPVSDESEVACFRLRRACGAFDLLVFLEKNIESGFEVRVQQPCFWLDPQTTIRRKRLNPDSTQISREMNPDSARIRESGFRTRTNPDFFLKWLKTRQLEPGLEVRVPNPDSPPLP